MTGSVDRTTEIARTVAYNQQDATSELLQLVLSTSLPGNRLEATMDFSNNVNFDGFITPESGWAAPYDTRAVLLVVPEPASVALAFVGLTGLSAAARRRNASH